MFIISSLLILLIPQNPELIYEKQDWCLKNKHMIARISKVDGNIRTLKVNNVDILAGSIVDYYNSGPTGTECIITQTEIENTNPTQIKIRIIKENPKISFIHEYTIDSICLQWVMEIIKKKDKTNNISIKLLLPILNKMSHFFCPTEQGSLPIKEDCKRSFIYRQGFFMPLITLFAPQYNIGLSVVPIIEFPKPGLTLIVDQKDLIVLFDHMNLNFNGKLKVGVNIVPHGGNWRAGLNYMIDSHPEYFNPKSSTFKIDEGWYYLSLPFENEKVITYLQIRGATWTELHNHFPFYGLYAPNLITWGSNIDSDKVGLTAREKGAGEKMVGYQHTNNLISLFNKHGIKTYLYFQPFEAWHQYSEKYFASDIAKDRSGSNIPGWQYCTLMNPDPASNWGKHIIEQANRIVEKYPTIDGIFYDRMDYCYYDYAHDDGITLIDGKPAYMLGFALEKMNDTIFKIFHNQGKAVWGNGPTSLEVCKNLDGIMAEGSLANLYKTQYLGLTRPIVYLPYDKTPDETEEKLKNCLLCGAFPSVTYGDSICQNLDEKYRPLFDILKGRTWILSPNPITVSDKYQSNIFRTRDGDYAVVVISPDKSQLYNSFEYNIPMTVNLSDVKDITNVYLLSGDWTGIYEIKFKKHENLIEFLIPAHISNSLVLLTRGKRYQISRFFDNRIWTLDDIILTPPKDIFIQSCGYETLSIDVTNNTGRKQALRITTKAINNNGEIQIPGNLTLGKYETKSITARIKTDRDTKFTVNAQNDHQLFSREFSVKTGLAFESDDLFHDDFSPGMDKWTINRGTWHVNNNVAEGSGPSHFAFILNDRWGNYQYQATTRIKGSDDPEVDWLKSYVFFRIRDDRNFYRFGIHGDGGVVDLFKCVNGEWIQLGFVNFMPKPDKWYTLMVEVNGNRITGFVDGKKIMETQDAAFSSGGIGIGVLEDAMRTEYRNIIVKIFN